VGPLLRTSPEGQFQAPGVIIRALSDEVRRLVGNLRGNPQDHSISPVPSLCSRIAPKGEAMSCYGGWNCK
jgi:hypothetical protein